MPVNPTNLFGILNTGRQGLFASQTGISVAGNNLANVNTEGYSRQRVIFDPSAFGNGVSVKTIQQIRNQFVENQYKTELESYGHINIRNQLLSQMEQIFDETNTFGIGTAFNEFFASLQDLTSVPGGTAQREAVRTQGQTLSTIFQSVRSRLDDMRKNADGLITQSVDEINSIAKQLAEVNANINRQQTANQLPNELIDQRERLLAQLSERIDIQHFINENNQAVVFVAGGQPLVEDIRYSPLQVEGNADNSGLSDVFIETQSGVRIRITNRIHSGEIAGALQVRDTVAVDQINQLDQLAAQFMTRFNLQHRVGVGLDGVTDRDFFSPVNVHSHTPSSNQGGAGVTTSSVIDQSLLTFDDYEIRFTDPTTYDIVNTSTGATLSSGNAYAPGGSIVFDGMSITLDNIIGAPVAGDVIEINSYSGASQSIGISTDIATSLEAIAAGYSDAPGDNQNALALANFESALLMNGGTSTFADTYTGQVTSLGILSQRAGRDTETQELVVQQVKSLVDSLSGVSMDEESTMLIQFERTFQANSRVIVTVDEMLQTIVNLV